MIQNGPGTKMELKKAMAAIGKKHGSTALQAVGSPKPRWLNRTGEGSGIIRAQEKQTVTQAEKPKPLKKVGPELKVGPEPRAGKLKTIAPLKGGLKMPKDPGPPRKKLKKIAQ